MNAVILAGGFGSRLKPLTDTVPKPMLSVLNTPMIDYCIAHLRSFGIADVVLTLGYYPEQIIDWVDGYEGLKAHYVIEDVPLGTAGGVREARDLLDEYFIVISGDALENIDFNKMLLSHVRSGKLVTMAVSHVEDARQFGLVKFDRDGIATEFTEKPSELTEGIVNCGVYILSRSAMMHVPHGVKYDFSRDLFPELLSRREINVYLHEGYWSDIGSVGAYYKANFDMLSGQFFPKVYNRYRVPSHKTAAENPSVLAFSALVAGRCSGSIVGHDSAVSSNASITDCIVLPSVRVDGVHYGEIIGEGFSMPVVGNKNPNQQISTQIYKNFS